MRALEERKTLKEVGALEGWELQDVGSERAHGMNVKKAEVC